MPAELSDSTVESDMDSPVDIDNVDEHDLSAQKVLFEFWESQHRVEQSMADDGSRDSSTHGPEYFLKDQSPDDHEETQSRERKLDSEPVVGYESKAQDESYQIPTTDQTRKDEQELPTTEKVQTWSELPEDERHSLLTEVEDAFKRVDLARNLILTLIDSTPRWNPRYPRTNMESFKVGWGQVVHNVLYEQMKAQTTNGYTPRPVRFKAPPADELQQPGREFVEAMRALRRVQGKLTPYSQDIAFCLPDVEPLFALAYTEHQQSLARIVKLAVNDLQGVHSLIVQYIRDRKGSASRRPDNESQRKNTILAQCLKSNPGSPTLRPQPDRPGQEEAQPEYKPWWAGEEFTENLNLFTAAQVQRLAGWPELPGGTSKEKFQRPWQSNGGDGTWDGGQGRSWDDELDADHRENDGSDGGRDGVSQGPADEMRRDYFGGAGRTLTPSRNDSKVSVAEDLPKLPPVSPRKPPKSASPENRRLGLAWKVDPKKSFKKSAHESVREMRSLFADAAKRRELNSEKAKSALRPKDMSIGPDLASRPQEQVPEGAGHQILDEERVDMDAHRDQGKQDEHANLENNP